MLWRVHHLDIIFVAIFTEIGSRRPINAVAQCRGGSGEVQAIDGKFFSIEVHLIFRLIVFAADANIGSTFHRSQQSLQLLCHTVGFFQVVAIDFVVEGRLSAHAAATATAHIHDCFLELGVVLEVFAHKGCNFHDAAFTFARVAQTYVH